MNKLIIKTIFLGVLQVTSYRSIPRQTKPSGCEWTANGSHVSEIGVAVSQDLLLSGQIKYGDWVYIEDIGLKQVFDCMNSRHKNRLDVWVRTKDEERKFDKQFGKRKLKIWIIKCLIERNG
jgi:3D (Asp-Asp-Asp) domain-containing protein